MSEYYNKRFKDEVLEQLLDKDGEPVLALDIIKRTTGAVVESDIVLKQKNAVVVNGDFINAGVMNNFNGKLNAHSEQIAMLMMVSELKDTIQSTGNDNLELFGVSNTTVLKLLNPLLDFGILRENVIAGANQIKIINANGYVLDKNLTVSSFVANRQHTGDSGILKNGKSVLPVMFINGSYFYLYGITHDDSSAITSVTGFSWSNYTRQIILIPDKNMALTMHSDFGDGGRRTIEIYNIETGAKISLSGYNSYTGFFYCDIDNRAYWFRTDDRSPYTAYMMKSPVITESMGTQSLTPIQHATLPNLSGSTGGKYPSKPLTCKIPNKKYAIVYEGISSTIFIVTNNYNTVTSHTYSKAISKLIYCNDFFMMLSEGKLYKVSKTSSNELNLSDNGVEIVIPFLEDRTINDVWYNNGLFGICGSNALLGVSINGTDFTEININNELYNAVYFTQGVFELNGNITVYGDHDSDSQKKGIYLFKNFNVEQFKNKRYVLGNEVVTVTDVNTVNDDIILNLAENLKSNHVKDEQLLRTSNLTIPTNTKRTIVLEFQNEYEHNAIVLIPIISATHNFEIKAEVCVKNSSVEVEEWIEFEHKSTIVTKQQETKITYYQEFLDYHDKFLVSLTITNNSSQDIVVNKILTGLSNEVIQ